MSQTKAQLLDGKSATIQFTGGSASTPSVSFTGDTNTGIYSPGADQVAISTNGTKRLQVDAGGNVSIDAVTNTGLKPLAIYSQARDCEIRLTTNSGTSNDAYVTLRQSGGNLDLYSTNGAITLNPANTERLRITSAGLVGVGTSSPSNLLHVSGTSSTPAAFERTGTTGAFVALKDSTSQTFIGNTNGVFSIQTPGSSYSDKLVVTSAGNVGVGTTSPGTALDVNGVITSRSDSFAAIRFRSSTGTDKAFLSYEDGSTSVFLNNYGSGPIVFKTVDAERVRIDSSGRVGIGTSSPQALLDITDTGNQPKLRLSTNTASNFLEISRSSSTGNYTFASEENGSSIIFATDPDGTGAQNRVTIDRYGKVGIGTTSPSISDWNPSSQVLHIYQNSVAGSALKVESSNAVGVFAAGSDLVAVGSISNDPLQFRVNVNEVGRFDTSGRLLVGTSSVSANTTLLLQGYNGTQTNAGGHLRLAIPTATPVDGANLGLVIFSDSEHTNCAIIRADREAGTWSSTSKPTCLKFSTTADGASSPTERMRIGQNGYIQCSETGTYSPDGGSVWHKFYQSVNERCLQTYNTAGTFTNYALTQYIAAGGGTGSGFASGFSDSGSIQRYIIFSNGNIQNTNNSYGAISDLKLKENIVDASEQWNDIKNLRVRKYNLKQGGAHTQIGVIAQEIELVSPGLVYETTDRDTDGNDLGTVTKNVNYSVLYMKAVKALQEAMERIETLEAKVAALESA